MGSVTFPPGETAVLPLRRVPHVFAVIDDVRVRVGLGSRLYLLRAEDSEGVEIQLPAGFRGEHPYFRFPWADEDKFLPGCYADPHRRVRLKLKAAHGASCRSEHHYLKYERCSGRERTFVPVLSCDMCGVYWAAAERGKPDPAKVVLVATALTAAVHVMQAIRGQGANPA